MPNHIKYRRSDVSKSLFTRVNSKEHGPLLEQDNEFWLWSWQYSYNIDMVECVVHFEHKETQLLFKYCDMLTKSIETCL